MSFSTGLNWGIFSIMIAHLAALDANIHSFTKVQQSWDHCSPISDTAILSSISVGTDLLSAAQLCHMLFLTGL